MFQEQWPIVDELLTDKQRASIEKRGIQAGIEATTDGEGAVEPSQATAGEGAEPLTKAEKKKQKKEAKKKKKASDDGDDG